jgi:hypothetical protein
MTLAGKPDPRPIPRRVLAAWIADSPGYFKNRGEPVPTQPTWGLVAQMLYAAHLYE